MAHCTVTVAWSIMFPTLLLPPFYNPYNTQWHGRLIKCTTIKINLIFSSPQTQEQIAKYPGGHLPPSLVTKPLTDEQWAQVDQVNADLTKEYSIRREMLLTRCDVTVQSFRWSDNVKVR